MARKESTDWLDIVKRLNEMSNITPEQERQELMEAAAQEPRILDDRDVSLADIAKLAGIKEYVEPVKVSKKAEQLIESIVGEKKVTEQSAITKIIEEADKNKESMGKKMEQEGQKLSKRLEQIAELEEKIAELKTQEIEENTYEPEEFKGKLRELLEYFLKNATMSQMADMYRMIADENIKVSEDGTVTIGELVSEIQENEEQSGFTDKQIKMAFGVLNDPKFKGGNYDGAVEVINKIAPGLADHSSVSNALKRANEDTNEASGYEGQTEYRKHTIKLAGDFSPEKPVSDADAEAVKKEIMKKSAEQGIGSLVVDVEPSEQAFDSVDVHTMRDREEILGYMGDMVEEQVEYTDDLSENKKLKKK